MEQRHNQENHDLSSTQQDELKTFNDFWDKKINEYGLEGDKLIADMEGRHQVEFESLRGDMEKQLPYKVKESSEYLNLKKMEEHMAKQKLYLPLYSDIPRLTRCRPDCRNCKRQRRKPGSTVATAGLMWPATPSGSSKPRS